MNLSAFYTVILALFAMLMVGYVARKAKIIDDKASKVLSTMVIKLGQPFMIISAMLKVEFSPEKLKNGITIFLLGILFHMVASVIAYFSVLKYKNLDERKISEFAIVFGNCGFIGFPLLEAVLGAEGLFYATFFVISFNIFLWTWGIAILARKRDDIKINPKNMLLNYGTLPCIIGLLIYISQVSMPDFIVHTTSYLGNICTPLSMLITGALIATVSFKELICDMKNYYVCIVKLILVPAIITMITWVLGFNYTYITFMAIVFSMPTATSTVIFGELFEIHKKRAAVITGISSVISIITMPIIVNILELIF